MFADKMRGYLWRAFLRARGAHVGENFQVRGSLDILLRDGARYDAILIDDNVSLGGRVYIRIRKQGQIHIGSQVRLGTDIWLVTANSAMLSIGQNSALGSYGIYNGGHGIEIGPDCMLAGFIYLNSSNHRMERGALMRTQGHNGSPITLAGDVWVGGHVSITSGVHIGEGAVIGTGSVVTRNVPAYAVAAGVPAKVIRNRE